MKTNEGNSLLWGASVAGSLLGPRGSIAWLPVLGPSVVVGSLLHVLRIYHTSSTQLHGFGGGVDWSGYEFSSDYDIYI